MTDVPVTPELDDHSFGVFFSETYPWVVGFLSATLRSTAGAEDAAQEAYIRALQRWAEIRTMARPDLWITKVAWRVGTDGLLRRRRREVPLEAVQASAEQETLNRFVIRWSLDRLSPRQRAVVVLHHSERLDVNTVAQILGLRRNTVRTHLERARENLREMLREDSGA